MPSMAHGFARSAHTSLPHPGTGNDSYRFRNHGTGIRKEAMTSTSSQIWANLKHERVAHFSMKSPAQFSAEINTQASHCYTGEYVTAFDDPPAQA